MPTCHACAARNIWLLADSELWVTLHGACGVCYVQASGGGTFVRRGCAMHLGC